MNNILVTGGAGFIGSNFVKTLLQKEPYSIVNLDLLTYSGRLENLHDIKSKKHSFVKGDIRNKRLIDKIIRQHKIDTIFNFAAETHVDRSLVHAESFISTDVNGTYVLLESARINKIENFIQISTDEVYGSASYNQIYTEQDALHPSNPYSASKAAADLMALSFYKSYDMNIKITRSSNNYGPYQYPEKFIPKMMTRAIRGEHVPVYGKGLQRRNWIYVEDNCRAILTVAERGMKGEVYNISGDDECSNIDLAKTVLSKLGLSEALIKFVEDRPGHDARYSIRSDKIRLLGWKPRHTLALSLNNLIEWYKNNEWWWKPLLSDKFVKSDTPWKI